MTDDLAIGAAGQTLARNRRAVRLQALRSGVWLPVGVVIALGAFFAVATPSFLTLRNASGILGQASTLLLACLGASFVVLMGSIDLSVGAMVLLAGAVTVTALNAGGIGVLALPLAVVFGTGLGLRERGCLCLRQNSFLRSNARHTFVLYRRRLAAPTGARPKV